MKFSCVEKWINGAVVDILCRPGIYFLRGLNCGEKVLIKTVGSKRDDEMFDKEVKKTKKKVSDTCFPNRERVSKPVVHGYLRSFCQIWVDRRNFSIHFLFFSTLNYFALSRMIASRDCYQACLGCIGVC